MKKYLIRFCALAMAILIVVGNVDAQTKKRTVKKRAPAKKTNVSKNQAAASASVAPKDTVKPAPPPVLADIKMDTLRKSLRNDAIIERNLVKDRTPLPYMYIREDDAVYRQRVWEEIDVHEKMNLPFVYKAKEDNGDQRLIYILLQAIKSGQVTAFDANVDDRFTTPITFQQIASRMVPAPHVDVDTRSYIKDPLTVPKGSCEGYKTISEMKFNPELVERYQVKEEWVFDKQSSTLQVRILGIAPELSRLNPDGSLLGVLPIFWVYYPDLRPLLSKFEAYNGKNYGAPA